ncbi:transposase [Nocardia sp. NPDC060220]|uniref:transposase n=1 Tax=Nocardia sp. NPDC060220 TaxID=3347076 RepID=UPI00364A442E
MRLGYVSQSGFGSPPVVRRVGHHVRRGGDCGDRHQVLTDNQWELLELLLPKSDGRVGRNFSNNRQVVKGMLFRLRTGMP